MQCPKCGYEAGDARFCAQCGTAFDSVLKPKRAYMPLVIAWGCGLALLGLLFATGALRLGGRSGDSALQVPGESQDVSLLKKGETGGPGLTVTGEASPPKIAEEGIGMPDDVRKWLEHLKRVDGLREGYNNSFAMTLIGKITSLRPGTFLNEEDGAVDEAQRKAAAQGFTGDVDNFFAKLTEDFQSLPPPAECGPIASQYATVLLETRGMLGQISQAVENLDTRSLEAMQGTTFSRLDTKAQEANTLIDDICKKYQEPNKYAVFVDKGNSLSLGAALMGGSNQVNEEALNKIYQDLLNEGIGQ